MSTSGNVNISVLDESSSKVSVFQTKDNGVRRQKVLLNPSLVLISEIMRVQTCVQNLCGTFD